MHAAILKRMDDGDKNARDDAAKQLAQIQTAMKAMQENMNDAYKESLGTSIGEMEAAIGDKMDKMSKELKEVFQQETGKITEVFLAGNDKILTKMHDNDIVMHEKLEKTKQEILEQGKQQTIMLKEQMGHFFKTIDTRDLKDVIPAASLDQIRTMRPEAFGFDQEKANNATEARTKNVITLLRFMPHTRYTGSIESLDSIIPSSGVMLLEQKEGKTRTGRLTQGHVTIHTPARGYADTIACSLGSLMDMTEAKADKAVQPLAERLEAYFDEKERAIMGPIESLADFESAKSSSAFAFAEFVRLSLNTRYGEIHGEMSDMAQILATLEVWLKKQYDTVDNLGK
jgi:hypothetical protein